MKYLQFILTGLIIPVIYGCNSEAEKVMGVKIYEYKGDYGELVNSWKEIGINTAFMSIELASDEAFRKKLSENKISVYIIFPVFQNPEALQADSTLYAIKNDGKPAREDWVQFACPSRKLYRQRKVQEASGIIRKLNPDGLSLDFIRQFVYWEMVYPETDADTMKMSCFCDSCIRGFLDQENISLPDTCHSTVQKANFLLKEHDEAWNDYRTDLIASMVKDIAESCRKVKYGLKINVHMVPWREGDFKNAGIRVAGQDLKKIAPYADYVSPMCYSQMVKRDAPWISSVTQSMDRKARRRVLPSIQVSGYYIDRPFTSEDFRKCVQAALKPPSRGVVFWSWQLFESDPQRKQVVKDVRE